MKLSENRLKRKKAIIRILSFFYKENFLFVYYLTLSTLFIVQTLFHCCQRKRNIFQTSLDPVLPTFSVTWTISINRYVGLIKISVNLLEAWLALTQPNEWDTELNTVTNFNLVKKNEPPKENLVQILDTFKYKLFLCYV